MKLTRRELAEVLDAASHLTVPTILHLRDYLEGRAIDTKRNPYSLRVMYYFLVGIKEYTRGAAKLRKRLATLVRKAGIDPAYEHRAFRVRHTAPTGGIPMAKKKRSKKAEEEEEGDEEEMPEDFDDSELEEDEEEEEEEEEEDEDEDDEDEEEEEEEEKPKKKTKKAPKAKAEKKTKKAKKGAARNEAVASEDRIPILVEKMKKPGPAGAGEGWTINELFQAVTQNKAGRALFATRRAVKRTLAAHEGNEFRRTSKIQWELNTGKKKKVSKKGTEKGKSKKDAKAKRSAEKKGEKKAKRKKNK